jgi:hypothetical protein
MRVSLSPKDFKELLLSHHPDLPCFNDDVIILFNRRICAGCLLAYPTALVVLSVVKPTGIDSIVIALLLAALSQFRRLTKNPAFQNFFRLIAGIALGFGIGGGYWAILTNHWFLVLLLASGAGVYTLLKARSMKRRFENCDLTLNEIQK